MIKSGSWRTKAWSRSCEACRAALRKGVGDVLIANGRDGRARHARRGYGPARPGCYAGGAMTMKTDARRDQGARIATRVQTYKRQPVAFVRGSGPRLYDVDGREYLDLVSGIGVTSLGHAHPGLAAAIAEQASTLLHTSNLYYHPLPGAGRGTAHEAVGAGARRSSATAARKRSKRASSSRGATGSHRASRTRTGFVALEGALRRPDDGRAVGDMGRALPRRRSSRCSVRVTFVAVRRRHRPEGRGHRERPPPSSRSQSRAKAASGRCRASSHRRSTTSVERTGALLHRGRSADAVSAARATRSTSRARPAAGPGQRRQGARQRRPGRRHADVASASRRRFRRATTAAPTAATCWPAAPRLCFLEQLMDKGLLDHVNTVGPLFERRLRALALKHPVIVETRGVGLMHGLRARRSTRRRLSTWRANAGCSSTGRTKKSCGCCRR